jgi:hypothetical protein
VRQHPVECWFKGVAQPQFEQPANLIHIPQILKQKGPIPQRKFFRQNRVAFTDRRSARILRTIGVITNPFRRFNLMTENGSGWPALSLFGISGYLRLFLFKADQS